MRQAQVRFNLLIKDLQRDKILFLKIFDYIPANSAVTDIEFFSGSI